MTEHQDEHLPEALAIGNTPFRDLITEAQRKNQWTDEDLAQRLGLTQHSLMALVRQGTLQLSYRCALSIAPDLDSNAVQMLQAFVRDQASAAEMAMLGMYSLLKVNNDANRIILAYAAILAGDKQVCTLKLPQATVLLVPEVTQKPDSEIDGAD